MTISTLFFVPILAPACDHSISRDWMLHANQTEWSVLLSANLWGSLQSNLSSRETARREQQKLYFFLLYPRSCWVPRKVPMLNFLVVSKKFTLILLYPHVPFWYVWYFQLWHNSLAGEIQKVWSLKFFPREDPILQKELCFLGIHWIAPLFSQEAVFTLCLTNHTPKNNSSKEVL